MIAVSRGLEWRCNLLPPVPYYVYILANRSHTIYTGVTNDLETRVRQHKLKTDPASFTARYNMTRLVYWEEFTSVSEAIEWEKRIKSWVRAKKVALIQQRNKYWHDLAAEWQAAPGSGTDSNPQPLADPAPAARWTGGPSLRSG